MARQSWGALVHQDHLLMRITTDSGGTRSFRLPGGEIGPNEGFDDGIVRLFKEQTGLKVIPHRLAFEDFGKDRRLSLRCSVMNVEPEDWWTLPVDLSRLPPIGHPQLAWVSVRELQGDPIIVRLTPFLKCTVWWWATKQPFNWVDIDDKERELEHRIRRAERYLNLVSAFRTQPDFLGQALLSISEHLPDRPYRIWDFVKTWGNHSNEAIRGPIAVYLLEELLHYHFSFVFPKISHLARTDPLYADCFLQCYCTGQAKRYGNRKAFHMLRRAVTKQWGARLLWERHLPERMILFTREPR